MSNDGKFLEELVYNKFRSESVYITDDYDVKTRFKVIKNHKVYDHKAETFRQIDVAIIMEDDGDEVLTAIECKNHKSKIDVPEVESFIEKLNGIGANQGIMISDSGFTKPAKKRGNKTPGLKLKMLKIEKLYDYSLHDYNYFNGLCEECKTTKSIFTNEKQYGYVPYYSFANVITEKGNYLKIYNGTCDRCHLIQYFNSRCGTSTPVLPIDSNFEYYYKKNEIPCADNCGLIYLVDDENLEVIYQYKKQKTKIHSEYEGNQFNDQWR